MAAETAPVLINHMTIQPNPAISLASINSPSIINPNDSVVAVEADEIPTIDYLMLFSDDFDERSKALENLGHVCKDFGFFYVRIYACFIFIFLLQDFRLRFICALTMSEKTPPN